MCKKVTCHYCGGRGTMLDFDESGKSFETECMCCDGWGYDQVQDEHPFDSLHMVDLAEAMGHGPEQ